MKELDTLHNKIGQLLVDAGPEDAREIIVCARLSPEGDTCEYEYDYTDNKGHQDWFVPDKNASYDLRLLLVELRKYYIENHLTNGLPAWNGCLVKVDLEKMKINIEFKYED
ncbi:hypothetical protein TI10_08260 [Photorhabdus luminescens subsp. luminescens]|uniref:DUF600 family protein n=2 Tax=Photorhabdus TaxID=29487 RepID=A0A1G5RK93_PHOLU|nr:MULTISPECIES: hypothetical protein [Photorhabdus]OHV57564.1 hypothetical protein BB987_21080 [Photorhabdus temperata]ETS32498.1 hypothetical protein PTE_01127 [Photorhabdus khanii NC19]KMW73113.1 hypothetical protein TI10_08260 [Photorhabdus luminescens subsp. luminescens]RAW93245.1 hypothetical protein CKY05_22285 [Photorhabdus sp. S10-54]RAW96775.1 hypothetical protein CKY04_22305 [Photorhabdus sp. S8-52]